MAKKATKSKGRKLTVRVPADKYAKFVRQCKASGESLSGKIIDLMEFNASKTSRRARVAKRAERHAEINANRKSAEPEPV